MSDDKFKVFDKTSDYENDAWYVHRKLLELYTKTFKPRNDITVVARGCHRSVELELDSFLGRSHNIGTMRELAQALIDACDFVEASNPKWTEMGANAFTPQNKDDT